MSILWIDVETTGLDYTNSRLLEVAAVITDDRAEQKEEYTGPALIDYGSKAVIDSLKSGSTRKVSDMHTVSGLWDDLQRVAGNNQDSCSAEELDFMLVDFITDVKHNTNIFNCNNKLYLGGRSLLLDRIIMNRDLPITASMVSYHSVDVATLETMASISDRVEEYDRPSRFERSHRAADDIAESIREYQYYIDAFSL